MTAVADTVGRGVVAVESLAERIEDRSARGIASAVGGLIEAGELAAGARLPTVRVLADELGVSPATVSDAWAELRRSGLLSTARRRGTVVRGGVSEFPGWRHLDLAQGMPDPALLPPLEEALSAGAKAAGLHRYDKEYITARLADAVAPSWPFRPESWTVVDGGYEGALLALKAAAGHGGLVAIEDPTAPRLLETLHSLGARTIGVPYDDGGPRPDALAKALRRNPAAFVFQPRAQLPTGDRLSEERARELARVLSRADCSTVVVEDDNLGPVAAGTSASLGLYLPGRVMLVRSYCKAYGLDMRVCVVSGPTQLVRRVRSLRSFGMVWTSRILQDALAHLITDVSTQMLLERAKARYARRRWVLARALTRRGLSTNSADGLVLWVPVIDEVGTMIALAERGIEVGSGSRCRVSPTGGDARVRVAVGLLPDDERRIEELANLIATASREHPRDEFD